MNLLTEELVEQIPDLYATEGQQDPLVHARFFTPDSTWSWYVLEFDGDDTCFGYVVGHYPELGYFSLSELESVRGPLGLPVERDSHFRSSRLSSVMRKVTGQLQGRRG
ncbi:MAG: DUF2958 domain-containing protein [Bacillota bacterium]